MSKSKKMSHLEEVQQSDELKEYIHIRKVIIERLSRFENYLSHNIDSSDVFSLETRLKSVEEDFQEFDRVQTRVEYIDSNEDQFRLDNENKFYSVISQAKKCIADVHKLNQSNKNPIVPHELSPQSFSGSMSTAQLPHLDLPNFHGTYESWFSFKDIFNSLVASRSDLSEISKFMYLKLCCKGDALKLIESLDVTAANYTIAFELLQKRYENKRAIINHHVNNLLFNLPKVIGESPLQLRKLIDTVHQHKSALEKLSLPVQHWDTLIIPVVLRNVDSRTARDWENKLSNNALPTLDELIEFLTKKCFTLEALNHANHNNSKSVSNVESSQKSNRIFKQQNQKPGYGGYSVTQNSYENKCPCCDESHFIFRCPRFAGLSISQKYNEIRKHRLCCNCLRFGHLKDNCMSSGCKKCNGKHNTLLHFDKSVDNNSDLTYDRNKNENKLPDEQTRTRETHDSREIKRPTMLTIDRNNDSELLNHNDTNAQTNNELLDNSQTVTYSNSDRSQILLSTATIFIADCNQRWHKCNALLDSGSQSNLISESLCKRLNLKREKIDIPLSGISQSITKINSRVQAKIKSRFTEFNARLSFLVLPVLTEKLPLIKFNASSIEIPKYLHLADEQFNTPKEIDLLLGAGIFYELLETGRVRLGDDMPTLQETCLGWVFSGKLHLGKTKFPNSVCGLVTNKDLHDSLTIFWEIENLEKAKKHLSKEETYCEEYFTETTTRNFDGSFIVKYPFNQNLNLELGDSKPIALKRLMSLERRLVQNKSLQSQYIDFMRQYEELGHMTRMGTLEDDYSNPKTSYFLPHTAVLRDSVTTKCRVVFDASSKTTSDASFNDIILVGPTIQEDLYSILLRLRLRNIVLSADVKMMYRCIQIVEDERSYQQILWRYRSDEPVCVYRLNTVTYGTSSAPFQATRCLTELANINDRKYPKTSEIIKKAFYMDDLLLSVNSIDEALTIYQELTEILNQANFKLRKWSSNNDNFITSVLKSNDNQNTDNLIQDHDNKLLKTLGIVWESKSDLLKYNINIKIDQAKYTKRTILSAVSKIFDPLGLIGPATIRAKLLIQTLWRLQLGWDDEIPQELEEDWSEFSSQLECLNQIAIKRQVVISGAVSVELYGFGDSSEKAYGACVYIRSIDAAGNIEVMLLTAKSKVAPVKKVTLPRLELLAAYLLAKLIDRVICTLDMTISRTVCYTDSTIVLNWLKIDPSKLKTFIANRVSQINEISCITDWQHVKTKDNPADVISRGMNPKDLLENDMWFNGPAFLRSDIVNSNSDINISSSIDLEKIPELKEKAIASKCMNTSLVTQQIEACSQFEFFNKYSSLRKMHRVFTYVCRFRDVLFKRKFFHSNVLSVEELNDSFNLLLKLAQQTSFQQELISIKRSIKLPNNSKLLSLNPFLDINGVLRVGGRLMNSNYSYDQRHPIILPYKHKLTDLIIIDHHMKHMHAGIQNLLSIIRLKFWIINGKNAVKKIIHSCIRCYKVNPKPAKFIMGSLPLSRVTPSRPFTNCGVDYAGPILVKEGTLRRTKLVKTYICIFICFATKAIHVELVKDLTTDSFLNALKRFTSRRGKPANIHSDNGLNFVGANNYFVELYNLLNNEEHLRKVQTYLADGQIKWHFIPARSAHMGGVWEAAVKSTKFHLKRVLGESALTYEEMYTLLVQIEGCLNSRPLIPISNDIDDYTPLTPSHFLIGDSMASPPEADLRDVAVSRLTRYQRLQQLYQQFWNRWSKDYLTNLHVRTKWKSDVQTSLKIGSLVLLMEDHLPPLRWLMARVVQLHEGADHVLRVVTVRLPSGSTVRRSLSKICPLPVDD